MKIVKYVLLFVICFVASMYFLNAYKHDQKLAKVKSAINKEYNQKKLSRISSPLLIDKGKIKENFIDGHFEVKNIGEFSLSDLKVVGDCSCTTLVFKNKNLMQGGTSIVTYKIDLSEEKGWFSKAISLEGSFFPYKRLILIEGYKL